MKKNNSISLFYLLCLLISINSSAQNVFQKKIFKLASYSELIGSIVNGIDSGYVFSGVGLNSDNTTGSVYIVKINEQGDTLWSRRYKAGTGGTSISLDKLYDSNYVVSGITENFNVCGGDTEDMYLMKLEANGDTVWTKHYGTCYPDYPEQIVKAPNNGYYLLGNIDVGPYSYGSSLLRLDAQGDTIWTKSINVTGYGKSQNTSCTATSDGGLIITGRIYDSTSAPFSSYLIKIDSSGNIQWHNYIDNPWFNYPIQMLSVSNGYILLGYCNLGGALGYGAMMIQTDLIGNPLWGKMYENINMYGNAATRLTDGTIFFTGTKQRGPSIPGQDNNDLISFKTDSIGNLLWAKKYVTNQLGQGFTNPLQTSGGGFLMAGNSTTDPTFNTYNGLLVKIDSLGNGCSDSTLAINVVDITSMIVTSDTINPAVSSYPVIVGRSPFNYGSGINYTDLCNGYVGVEDEKSIENELLIYPNPVTDKITIEFETSGGNGNSISIINILGQTIKTFDNKQFSIGKNKMEIDISNLSNGLYFVQFYDNKILMCKKFIKE